MNRYVKRILSLVLVMCLIFTMFSGVIPKEVEAAGVPENLEVVDVSVTFPDDYENYFLDPIERDVSVKVGTNIKFTLNDGATATSYIQYACSTENDKTDCIIIPGSKKFLYYQLSYDDDYSAVMWSYYIGEKDATDIVYSKPQILYTRNLMVWEDLDVLTEGETVFTTTSNQYYRLSYENDQRITITRNDNNYLMKLYEIEEVDGVATSNQIESGSDSLSAKLSAGKKYVIEIPKVTYGKKTVNLSAIENLAIDSVKVGEFTEELNTFVEGYNDNIYMYSGSGLNVSITFNDGKKAELNSGTLTGGSSLSYTNDGGEITGTSREGKYSDPGGDSAYDIDYKVSFDPSTDNVYLGYKLSSDVDGDYETILLYKRNMVSYDSLPEAKIGGRITFSAAKSYYKYYKIVPTEDTRVSIVSRDSCGCSLVDINSGQSVLMIGFVGRLGVANQNSDKSCYGTTVLKVDGKYILELQPKSGGAYSCLTKIPTLTSFDFSKPDYYEAVGQKIVTKYSMSFDDGSKKEGLGIFDGAESSGSFDSYNGYSLGYTFNDSDQSFTVTAKDNLNHIDVLETLRKTINEVEVDSNPVKMSSFSEALSPLEYKCYTLQMDNGRIIHTSSSVKEYIYSSTSGSDSTNNKTSYALFCNTSAEESGTISVIIPDEEGSVFPESASVLDKESASTFLEEYETYDLKPGTTVEFSFGNVKERWVCSRGYTLTGHYSRMGTFLGGKFYVYAKKDSGDNIVLMLSLEYLSNTELMGVVPLNPDSSSTYENPNTKKFTLFKKSYTTYDDIPVIKLGDVKIIRNKTVCTYYRIPMPENNDKAYSFVVSTPDDEASVPLKVSEAYKLSGASSWTSNISKSIKDTENNTVSYNFAPGSGVDNYMICIDRDSYDSYGEINSDIKLESIDNISELTHYEASYYKEFDAYSINVYLRTYNAVGLNGGILHFTGRVGDTVETKYGNLSLHKDAFENLVLTLTKDGKKVGETISGTVKETDFRQSIWNSFSIPSDQSVGASGCYFYNLDHTESFNYDMNGNEEAYFLIYDKTDETLFPTTYREDGGIRNLKRDHKYTFMVVNPTKNVLKISFEAEKYITGIGISDDDNVEANYTFYKDFDDKYLIKFYVGLYVYYNGGSKETVLSGVERVAGDYDYSNYTVTLRKNSTSKDVYAKVRSKSGDIEIEEKLYKPIIKEITDLPVITDKVKIKGTALANIEQLYYYKPSADKKINIALERDVESTFGFNGGIRLYATDGTEIDSVGDPYNSSVSYRLEQESVEGEKAYIIAAMASGVDNDYDLTLEEADVPNYLYVGGKFYPQFGVYDASASVEINNGNTVKDYRIFPDYYVDTEFGTLYVSELDDYETYSCIRNNGRMIIKGASDIDMVRYISKADDTESLYDVHLEDLPVYTSGTSVSVNPHSLEVYKLTDSLPYSIKVAYSNGSAANGVVRRYDLGGDGYATSEIIGSSYGSTGYIMEGSDEERSYLLLFQNTSDKVQNFTLTRNGKRLETFKLSDSVSQEPQVFYNGIHSSNAMIKKGTVFEYTLTGDETTKRAIVTSTRDWSDNGVYFGDDSNLTAKVTKDDDGKVSITPSYNGISMKPIPLYTIERKDIWDMSLAKEGENSFKNIAGPRYLRLHYSDETDIRLTTDLYRSYIELYDSDNEMLATDDGLNGSDKPSLTYTLMADQDYIVKFGNGRGYNTYGYNNDIYDVYDICLNVEKVKYDIASVTAKETTYQPFNAVVKTVTLNFKNGKKKTYIMNGTRLETKYGTIVYSSSDVVTVVDNEGTAFSPNEGVVKEEVNIAESDDISSIYLNTDMDISRGGVEQYSLTPSARTNIKVKSYGDDIMVYVCDIENKDIIHSGTVEGSSMELEAGTEYRILVVNPDNSASATARFFEVDDQGNPVVVDISSVWPRANHYINVYKDFNEDTLAPGNSIFKLDLSDGSNANYSTSKAIKKDGKISGKYGDLYLESAYNENSGYYNVSGRLGGKSYNLYRLGVSENMLYSVYDDEDISEGWDGDWYGLYCEMFYKLDLEDMNIQAGDGLKIQAIPGVEVTVYTSKGAVVKPAVIGEDITFTLEADTTYVLGVRPETIGDKISGTIHLSKVESSVIDDNPTEIIDDQGSGGSTQSGTDPQPGPNPQPSVDDTTTAAPVVEEPSKVDDTETPKKETLKTPNIKASDLTKAIGAKPFKLSVKTDSDGKVSYQSSNKKVAIINAKGKVTLKGTGKAKITISTAKTATFEAASKTITLSVIVPAVKKVKLSSPKKGSLKYTWNKVKNITGYEVQIDIQGKKRFKKKNKDYKSKIYSAKTTGFAIGAPSGKKYNIRIRALKKIGKKTYYSSWSKVSSVKVK